MMLENLLLLLQGYGCQGLPFALMLGPCESDCLQKNPVVVKACSPIMISAMTKDHAIGC
jgi:hypothetical protein